MTDFELDNDMSEVFADYDIKPMGDLGKYKIIYENDDCLSVDKEGNSDYHEQDLDDEYTNNYY